MGLQWRAGQLPGQTTGWDLTPAAVSLLQWRAGQLPGQTSRANGTAAPMAGLQWRAGQLPGQTVACESAGVWPGPASMEGRAIARPNSDRRLWRCRVCRASMEGRAIARPNRLDRFAMAEQFSASMEGRAIARPNEVDLSKGIPTGALQWRAGQLPGQTARQNWCV